MGGSKIPCMTALQGMRAMGRLYRPMVGQTDVKALIQDACDILASSFGCESVWIALPNGNGAFSATAASGNVDACMLSHEQIKQVPLPRCIEAVRGERAVLVLDNRAKNCPPCPLAPQQDGRALLMAPIAHQETFLGVLAVAGPSLFHQDAEGHLLFSEIAADLGHALCEINVHEQTRLQASILEEIRDLVTLTDLEGRILYVNPAELALMKRDAAELLGRSVEIYGDDPYSGTKQRDIIEKTKTNGEWRGEIVNIAGTGEEVTLDSRVWVMHNAAGAPQYLCGVARDITERKRSEKDRIAIERQIQQTQKLESLGVLAGGIAHDFNNILMAILGHAELAFDELSPMSLARDSLRQIETAARRAAELCRQMLAYAGRASFVTEPVDLALLIDEMVHLLKTSISKKAILNIHVPRDLPPILADPSQVRQVIMNLIVNASEAIGDRSGVISIAAGAAQCDAEYLRETYLNNDLANGLYVYIEIADTGCGMDAETRARIFEPFFTTKFTGRGLGMAAVLGIVRAHGGAMKVYSELGKGTSFKILFPACLNDKSNVAQDAADQRNVSETGGLALLVDDEETLRDIGGKALQRLGFSVLNAGDGLEAVELYRQYGNEIDVVLLDLTMPHMDGVETFSELRRLNPKVRIVLTSGYNETDVAARFAGKGLSGVLQKPYKFSQLREVLRKVLAAPENADETP